MKILNLKIVWMILGLIAFSMQASAQDKTFDDSVLSESGRQAYRALLKINMFAIGGVGYGGSKSKGEVALKTLLQEKEAVEALKNLTKSTLPEGALYGVFGLKVLKCDCFDEEFKKFVDKAELGERMLWGVRVLAGQVNTMVGCLGGAERRVDIAEKIKSGEFDSYIERHVYFGK